MLLNGPDSPLYYLAGARRSAGPNQPVINGSVRQPPVRRAAFRRFRQTCALRRREQTAAMGRRGPRSWRAAMSSSAKLPLVSRKGPSVAQVVAGHVVAVCSNWVPRAAPGDPLNHVAYVVVRRGAGSLSEEFASRLGAVPGWASRHPPPKPTSARRRLAWGVARVYNQGHHQRNGPIPVPYQVAR